MDDKVKKFIEENINLIEEDKWEEVYKKANFELGDSTGKFTEALLDANIHPEEYLSKLPSLFLHESDITNFNIPSNITSISWGVFSGCINLTSIKIPNAVISIGSSTFRDCQNLTSVTIGNNVKIIDDCAFCECKSLTSIRIPKSVNRIGNATFAYCDSLTNVEIPKSVQLIGEDAFAGCGDNLVITYNGTKAQFRELTKQVFTYTYYTCYCTDGEIVKKKR